MGCLGWLRFRVSKAAKLVLLVLKAAMAGLTPSTSTSSLSSLPVPEVADLKYYEGPCPAGTHFGDVSSFRGDPGMGTREVSLVRRNRLVVHLGESD